MLGARKMSILHPEYFQVFNGALFHMKEFINNMVGCCPDVLYHYTPSYDTIAGIIQNRELWLTNMAYLNDVSELDYIKSLAYENGLCSEMKQIINDWQPVSLNHPAQAYVMSFTTKPDYLPLWATFTKMEGYCVGFNAQQLRDVVLSRSVLNVDTLYNGSTNFDTLKALVEQRNPDVDFQGAVGGALELFPVIYDKQEQVKILNKVVHKAIQGYQKVKEMPEQGLPQSVIKTTDEHGNTKTIGQIVKDDCAYNAAVDKILYLCAALFKSSDFEYEHEWRLIKNLEANNEHLLHNQYFVRQVGNSLLPYVKLKLRNNLSFAIKEVITAPLALSDTILPGLELALFNAGYLEVPVRKSEIRLRRF